MSGYLDGKRGEMKLITERGLIREVANRWREQYPAGRSGADKDQIWQRLSELDPEKASAEEVGRIIGNKSWATICCDECMNDTKAVVELGEEPSWESRTIHLCRACAEAALTALTESQTTRDTDRHPPP